MANQSELQAFTLEFREGLIGTQPKASQGMCALVSIPLRAALKVILGVDTELVTVSGHTFLVTPDGQCSIDPTIDQFYDQPVEKVSVAGYAGEVARDERLSALPFIALLENFQRLSANEGRVLGAREAGTLVATCIFYPLAQQGFFDGRMA